MNKDIMKQAGFGKEVAAVEAGLCPICREPIDMTKFRNDLSRKEFKISGICQKDQDMIFGT